MYKIKFIHGKCMYIEAQTTNQSIFSNFKSLLLYIFTIYVAIFFIDVFFFKLTI
jgi:purine-cytosine permease-like protein